MQYNLGGDGNKFGLHNLNPLGSAYANEFGLDPTIVIQKYYDAIIHDNTPKQFIDVTFMNMLASEQVNSDEFFYPEHEYDRKALVATGTSSAVDAPNTAVIPVASIDNAAENMIIVSQDNSKAMIIGVDGAASTVTIRPYEGGSFPAVVAGEVLPVVYPGEADGADDIASYYRMDVIEKFNYIQFFSKGIAYEEVEHEKLMRNGTFSNFITMERNKMRQHMLIDKSNALWNGKKGVIRNSKGKYVKMTGGLYEEMIEGGSPVVETAMADIKTALKALVNATNVGEYGERKYLFASNEIIQEIQEAYKDEKTRYTPGDRMMDFTFDAINFGSVELVLMPMNRFTDTSSFPSFFGSIAFILDPSLMTKRYFLGPRGGETPDNRNNGFKRRSKEEWIDDDFGLKINNIKAFGLLKIV